MRHEKTDQERAEDALSFLNADDRDIWVKMAFAVKNEFGEDGFDIWDRWSQSSDTYRAADAKSTWKSTKAGGKVAIGTLFFMAAERGWKDNSVRKQVSAEEKAERAAARARRDAEEAAELAVIRAAAAERANSIWGAATECVEHPYLTRKQVKSHGLRVGTWEVIDKDTRETHTITRQALLVPIRDAGKRIHSLQAIYPAKVNGRDKDYLAGGAKSGLFYSIGKPVVMNVRGTQRAVILVGEGYATMATAHEMTDHAVIVAFDAGNLPTVGRVLRARFPEAALVFLADNDRWTEGNPGLKHATAAAEAVGGYVALPVFPEDAPGQPKDFNDLFEVCGPDAVCDTIAEAINPPETIPEDDGPEPPPWEDLPAGHVPDVVSAPVAVDDDGGVANNRNFRILGYNRDFYYIFLHGKRQIKEATGAIFSETGLIELADINWWEIHYPGERTKIDTKMAANAIIRTAEARGIYDPSRVRGRGAWVDEGRMIYHHGDYLSVNCEATEITSMKSRYVYELDRSLPPPADEPMTDTEGQQILDMAKVFRWTKPCSAALVAGWVALAPMCGALRWRPHLWLTGGAGCGKALPHSGKVLTPSGWKTMGEVCLGDLVTTPDNGVASVIGLFPQGVRPVYKLTFADGRTARASGDHLWKVRIRGQWRLRTTEDMIEVLSRGSRQTTQLAVPLSEAVDVVRGHKVTLPLHPYVLGALLGDGSLGNIETHDGITFTSADPEIANRVSMLAPDGQALINAGISGVQFRFKGLDEYGRSMRSVISDMRILGKKSHDKFIPQAYLDASVADRVELLKGLMDTDGYVSEGGSLSYCTISPKLRDGVVTLVRSLGGIASVGEKLTTYTHNGQKKSGQLAYNINIRLKDRAMAFHLERKVARARQDYQYADCLYLNVESIELDGEEECSCIAIDHPDRLYLTDDFVVTHNTTVLNDYVHYLMGGLDLYAQGNSSEAGIRQTLMADARPVLFDESESNEEMDARRIQNVLSLIRQSSTESEAQTLKGTAGGSAMHFNIRSMFCLASIQVALKQQADIERLAVLALRPKRDDKDAAGTWVRISAEIYKLKRDPTLPSRLFRRSMNLLPVTIKNILVFANAAAEKFNSQRDGDQYGTLLAGAWSLISTELATKEQAMALIDSYDWSEHRENNETDEGQRALASLMGSHVRVKAGIEVTVYELVCAAYGEPTEMADVSEQAADAILQRYGMKVRGDRLLLANNNDSLKKLMSGTTFEADYRGVLLRVDGADRNDNKPSRFSGVSTKCFSLPLGPIVASDRVEPAF